MSGKLTKCQREVLEKMFRAGITDGFCGQWRKAVAYWQVPTTVPTMNRLQAAGLLEPVGTNGAWWRITEDGIEALAERGDGAEVER